MKGGNGLQQPHQGRNELQEPHQGVQWERESYDSDVFGVILERWNRLELFGIVWNRLELFGNRLELFGIVWNRLEPFGTVWLFWPDFSRTRS